MRGKGSGPSVEIIPLDGVGHKAAQQDNAGGFHAAKILLVDLISAAFIGVGLSLGIFTMTVLEASLWPALGWGALSAALIAFFRLRWWVAPAVVLAGGMGMTIYQLAANTGTGSGEFWIATVNGFAQWVLSGAGPASRFAESGYMLLQFLTVFAITAIAFVIVRRFFLFPLVLAAVAGVMIPIYLLGSEEPLLGLCVCLCGLIVLMPRVYHRAVAQNGAGSHSISRASMQGIALPIAVVGVLLVNLLLPAETAGWRSQRLVNLANDIGTLIGGPFDGPRAGNAGFHFNSTGFMPLSQRLGGPVELDKTKVLTLVSQDPPTWLRGAVEDYYSGYNWSDSGNDGDFRLNSLFWRGYRSDTFDYGRPLGGREARQLYNRITQDVSYQLIYEGRRFTAVFAGGRMMSVKAVSGMGSGDQSQSQSQAYFNMQGEIYFRQRIPRRGTLSFTGTRFLRELEDFDEIMGQLEALTLSLEDKRYVEIAERYTQLPEELPVDVRRQSEEIVRGCETPYEKAASLERWLAQNCTYVLDPVVPPEGGDFVTHFLETREGYCTYYATAMAVMARCVGLPARYVTGFGVNAAVAEKDRYAVTNEMAHAWVEIYFNGIGWMEFDPLRWSVAENQISQEGGEAEPTEPEAANPPVQEEMPVEDPSAYEAETAQEGGASTRFGSWWLVIVAAVAALAILLAVRLGPYILLKFHKRRYEVDWVCGKYANMSDRVEHYYRDIIFLLHLLRIDPWPGETHLHFGRRVDRRVSTQVTMERVCEIQVKLRFAQQDPTMEDLEQVCRFHRELDGEVLYRLGSSIYFWRRLAGSKR